MQLIEEAKPKPLTQEQVAAQETKADFESKPKALSAA